MDQGEYASAPSRVASGQFWRMGTKGGAVASGRRELVSRNATHLVTRTAFVAVEAKEKSERVVAAARERATANNTNTTAKNAEHDGRKRYGKPPPRACVRVHWLS